MVDAPHGRLWLSATAASCAGLSIVGSLYILGRYWYVRFRKARSSIARRRVDVTQELIHVLAWFDLLGALGRAFGHLPAKTFDQSKGEPTTAVCELQAFAISFSDTSAIMWNFLMAFNLYRWVCLGEDQQRLTRTIKWYILGTLMFAATITGMALGYGIYGDATIWCWITLPEDPTRELYWKLCSLYIWIIALAVAMAVLLVLVKLNVQRRLAGVDNADARIAYKSVVQTLTIYIVAFIFCWTPPVVNRLYTWITGRHNFSLQMLHVSIISVQGFVNAVIYGKFHVWLMRRILCQKRLLQDRSSLKQSKSLEESASRTGLDYRHNHLQIGIASIFVTTFDMDWAPLPTNLGDWIPAGKDLYVFNLQHCMGVQLVEQAIREYLMRMNFPMGYRSITSLAGSLLRGDLEDASICQMIFINNSDVVSGNFQCKTEDRRQWAQWKSNRDVVGVPIRYFDSAIAFVSCNLDNGSGTSPAPGRSQPKTAVHTKIAATANLLRSFSMGADRSTVEFPHLYHHTFLSGNFNFGIAQPHEDLLSSMDRAYKAECLKRATDIATQAKLQDREAQPKGFSTHSDYAIDSTSDGFDRFSQARTSTTSLATDGDSIQYSVLYTSNDDGLPFTELQSPSQSSFCREHSEVAITINGERAKNHAMVSGTGSQSAWLSFLDRILPTTSPRLNDRATRNGTLIKNAKDSNSPMPSPHSRHKAIGASLARSRFTAEYSHTNWQELTQHDELRVAMEAREVLAGFEEPAIAFLPSYPRRHGVSASFLMRSDTSTKEFFADSTDAEPAFVDRVLLHSLPDTRKRIRNVGYWSCEAVATSSHKPVCSEFELEVDRFFAYKSNEASLTDVQAGNIALRDKTDIHEFKVKLINLDVNMWTYQPTQRGSLMNPLRRLRSPSLDVGQVNGNLSIGTSPTLVPDTSSRRAISTRLLDSSRSQASLSGSPALSRRGRRDSLDSPQVELVTVEPSKISTVFPLPSEDVYALQRKVYEVAHAVQKGFLSSSLDGESEEASLAYTNSRTVSWRDAAAHGVSHSAIMKPVNGVLHVAIHVDSGMKGQGGQGILCIDQPDLFTSNVDLANEEDQGPIPFDIPLTWGGKHVGYLHGDIVSGFQ